MMPLDTRNKTHVIIVVTTLVAVVTLFFLMIIWSTDKEGKQSGEKKWYVENLEYDFYAQIDTAYIIKQYHGFGRIYCTPIRTKDFDYYKEDSLSAHLSAHYRLRFIWQDRQGQLNFTISNGLLGTTGDEIYVNSHEDKIIIFKNGVEKGQVRLSSSLESI